MKKNYLLVIGLLLVVAGVVIAYCANFALADITGFAVTVFGAGVATANLWDKRDPEKKTWLSVTSVVLIAAGSFILGFGGFSENTMTTIISSVMGFVAIIAGLITGYLQAKN